MHSFQSFRSSKKVRIIVIVCLLIIAGVIGYFYEKTRWIILGAMALLLIALGMEVSNTDFDMKKLVETGSLKESRIERDEKGNINLGTVCSIESYDCKDFRSQMEAQEVFDHCRYGASNDPHGLDGDKDGSACESLPAQ